MKMLPMAYTVVGESRAHAQEREQMFLHDFVDPMASLTLLSELMNYDFSGLELDAPITDELIESVSGIRGLVQNLRTHIGGDTVTLADLAGHRATLLQGPRFVGTGPEVADQMEEWFTTDACDGFVVAATHSPGAYEDVVRLVVPELQRRGVFRDRYTGLHAAREPRAGPARVRRPWLRCRAPWPGCGWSTQPRWWPDRWSPPRWASSAPRSSRWSSPAPATRCAHGETARTAIGLVWKSVSRNKRCVTLDLRQPEGQDLFHQLLDRTDVLVVGNRPSALARWGVDYESVHPRHPRLVMLHISGYGRGGPSSDRPGFGTLAEAMSGFAQVTGQADGPPTLPPFMLADGVAAQAATWAVMMALYHRDVRGGDGQLIDVNLIEPLARLIESSTLSFDQLGISPGRVGNRLAASAPRNAYRTADDKWLAISSASSNIVVRVYRSIGRPDLAENPEYVDPVRRQERGLEVDALVADWVRQRPLDEAMKVFLEAEVAAAPVYDAEQLLTDEHLWHEGPSPRSTTRTSGRCGCRHRWRS